jgi:CheY-like chemotaxis protein
MFLPSTGGMGAVTQPMEAPKRIVVADDDPKVRRLFEHALKAPEFEVHAFPSGAQALQAMSHLRPDCVVSDMLMPDMDGEKLLRGLRSMSGLENVPFLVVSAIRSEARIQSVLSAGASAFLLKPFPVKDLVRQIRSLLDGSTTPSAPPPRPDAAEAGLFESLLLDGDFYYEEAPAPLRTELRPPATSLGFGRYTQVIQGGRTFVVLTEVDVGPRFTVTTVVSERGMGRRRIQTSLQHPLAREEDREVVRSRVDRQHEEAIEHLPELVDDTPPRKVVWSDRSRTVDAALLAWTVSAVARAAQAEVGLAESMRVLRRTFDRAAVDEADLQVFEVTPRGRVAVVSDHVRQLPRRVAGAVAAWCRDLLCESLQVDADAVVRPIRNATRQRGRELERIGFYERLQNVTAS